MMMRSLALPAREEEQMDAADLAPETYSRVLTDLASVNRWTMATRPTIRFLARALGDRRSFTLLDVGFGDGDMLRAIAIWAARRGIVAKLTGVDLNPKSKTVAEAKTAAHFEIRYRTGDYREYADEKPDFIISSLVTHHMDTKQRIAFLRDMHAKARIGWYVNDLHRHRLAYLGFPVLARLMRWHRIVRQDGRLSIARSFRRAEWWDDIRLAGIDPARVKVVRQFPFRLCVEHIR
jgi:2-polyprenyl-3-methyl-5-hydroxy-6-metoxy-1,4-benzoquinol methylase